MPSNHLILCCPLLPPPSVFPRIRVFSNESALRIRWPNYWNFSFSISRFNEYFKLISFSFHLLAVQGTLKSLLHHHSSKASILWHSAFFIVQLISIHDYWKNNNFDYMDLCRQSNVFFFKYLSRFFITSSFKEQASLNFVATVTIYSDVGDEENKDCHCYHCFPFYLP